MKPYQAKVASSIYKASNCALKSRMIGRFNSASSVIKLVRQDKDLASLYEETRRQDIYYIEFFVNSNGPNKLMRFIQQYSCPTRAMNEFRLKFVNPDMINPSSPAIAHQLTMRRWYEVPLNSVKRTIIMIVDPSFNNRGERRGDRLPYIGGSTKIRFAKGLLEIMDPEPTD